MQFDFINFSRLAGTLEAYGENLVLKLSVIPGQSDADYLSRGVTTLLNFGAIDFIPEVGVREYENLRPYNAGVDSYAMLQTSDARLARALETLGSVQAYHEWKSVLDKRDTSKPRVKINPRDTDLFPEIEKLRASHASAFLVGQPERLTPSDAKKDFVVGTF